ncbi:hypothetical protein EYC80_005371 [Monilinia laxa]|uniref:Uncharacterized protein n=1 Tax=Monilinia laxa TaxID=61186 RepID=A0A5N6KJQ5_MONLA|nr:hypothetical protein EYC80_005371 [Monilinia laxa]
MSELAREDAQEYTYESIQENLQMRAIEAAEPHKRGITLILSTEKILEITSQVENHHYFKRLGRPDFTKYTIDFKIWQHLFADNKGENTVHFTAANPLIARPLDGKIDFSSMPPNPFPVLAPVMNFTHHHHDTPQMRGGYDSIQTASYSSFDSSMGSQFRSMPKLARNDSGYHGNPGESSAEVQQAEHAKHTISARRSEVEEQRRTALNEARRCEDEARYFEQRGKWMRDHVDQLMIQLMALNDEEEVQFSKEGRLIQLQAQKYMIDDEIGRIQNE